MVVQVLRYKLKPNSLAVWKEIMKVATPIYKKYGKTEAWQVFCKKGGNFISVIELATYATRQKYQKIMEGTMKDKDLSPLVKRMKTILYSPKINDEVYEPVDTSEITNNDFTK